jgi:hypothetical protein
MKKVLGLLTIAAIFATVACGPSAADLAKKKAEDSIKVADSLKRVQFVADSTAAVAAAAKAKQDSVAKADSIAKAEASKPAKKASKKK